MNFIILISSSFLDVMQTILAKKASEKSDTKFMLSFNFIKGLGAFIILFLLLGMRFSANTLTVVLGTLYGLLLLSSMCTSFMALNCGSMAVTAIIISYSVIIPFFFGITVLDERIGMLKIAGLILLLLSILLMNYNKSGQGFGKKWAFLTFSCFLTNGLCSVVQKVHQTIYPEQYCKEFMVIAFGVIILALLMFLLLRYKSISVESSKSAVLSGMFTGVAYLLSLYLASVFNATVLFPILAVCAALFNCIASRIIFKDKLRKTQIVAVVLGVVSVILIQ